MATNHTVTHTIELRHPHPDPVVIPGDWVLDGMIGFLEARFADAHNREYDGPYGWVMSVLEDAFVLLAQGCLDSHDLFDLPRCRLRLLMPGEELVLKNPRYTGPRFQGPEQMRGLLPPEEMEACGWGEGI